MARGVGDGVHEGPVGKFGGVEGACAFVGDVARFVVRKQVQARIEGRHGSDRNVEIVVRGVESRAVRALRDGESRGLSVAGEKKRRTAGRTRILGKGHVDLGVPCRSFFCGEGQPVGFFVLTVVFRRQRHAPGRRSIDGDLAAAGEVVERQKIGSAVDADRRSSVVRTGPGSGREAQDQKETK